MTLAGVVFLPKRCKKCERERAERQAERLMESLLCIFSDEVWCKFDKVPKPLRVSSVCNGCVHYANFMAGMDAEDEALMDEIDDIRLNPEKYGYSGGS